MDAQFNSVFDDAVEVEKTFDTIFGGEEDDQLIGAVLGEAADDADFDTLDDGITPKKLEDELDNGTYEKPTIDSEGEFDIKDKEGGLGDNLACDKYGVADAVQKTEPDEENLEGEEEKAEKKVDLEESVNLDALYEDGDGESEGTSAKASEENKDDDGAAPSEDIPESKCETTEDIDIDVEDDDVIGGECGDGSCSDCSEEEKCDKTDYQPAVPDGNANVVAIDTDSDVEDNEEACGESVDLDAIYEETNADDMEVPKDPDKDNGIKDGEEKVGVEDNEEACGESVDLDSLYESDEAVEDEIIDTVEDNDEELSDSELQDLVDNDDDDDAIIDEII